MSVRRRTTCALVLAATLASGCAPQGGGSAAGDGADRPQVRRGAVPSRPPRPVASPSAAARPTAAPAAFPAYAATARGAAVAVHDAPGGRRRTSLASPLPSGAPLTLLMVRRQGAWLQVLLPVRPNGSTGWVRQRDVVLEGVPYRLDVRTAAHELRLYDRGRLVRTFPIGIGKRDTPTPGGTFYLKELLRPPDPDGAYGPYAYGLSGFSTTLASFRGGEAVIGLHGTSDPSSIGRDVSSGCIRLRNADIRELAALLPLGTPVRILA